MALDPDKHRLPADQLRQVFEKRVRPALFPSDFTAAPDAKPKAIIFGGQPGAGKSKAMESAIEELGGADAAVQIVGDDLRGYLPAYSRLLEDDDKTAAFYTDRDSGRLVEMSIEHACALRVPVAIEGTMRDAEKVAHTLQLFRRAGYTTEARALAVPFEQSWLGVLLRYEIQRMDRGVGRMTTPQAHQVAFDALPETLARIEASEAADIVTVVSREGELLYRSDAAGATPAPAMGAREVLLERRSAPWTQMTYRAHEQRIEQLRSLLLLPERKAQPADLAVILTLKSAARAVHVLSADRDQDLPRPR